MLKTTELTILPCSAMPDGIRNSFTTFRSIIASIFVLPGIGTWGWRSHFGEIPLNPASYFSLITSELMGSCYRTIKAHFHLNSRRRLHGGLVLRQNSERRHVLFDASLSASRRMNLGESKPKRMSAAEPLQCEIVKEIDCQTAKDFL